MTVLVHEAFGDGTRLVCFLHGILGSRRNWLSFARRFVRTHPDHRFVVVDLRAHGDSPRGDPPHTLAACAADLAETFAQVGDEPALLVGHSFGGKVALTYARDHGAALDDVVLVDSPPSITDARRGRKEIESVLAVLGEIELPIPDRGALVDALRARGLSEPIARWMTTNVRPIEGGLTWRFDRAIARDLVDDYGATDFVPYLRAHSGAPRFTLVRGGRSDRFTPDDDVVLADLVARGKLAVHVVPDAGHWLHTDDPDALARVLDELVARGPAKR